MYKCIICGKKFEEWRKKDAIKNNPIPLYCSRNCSNKRIHSKETKEKIRNSMKEYISKNPNIFSKEEIEKRIESFKKTIKEKIMNMDFSLLGYDAIKKRLFYEQNGKCNKCGNDMWLGKPIPLELEHKDGNHNNNSRDNVELLCPNCHAQTDTYRGKNVNNAYKKYTDENILEAFIKYGTIHKALKSLGMAAKGKNYERVEKILIQYGYYVKKENGRRKYTIIGH